MPNTYCEGCGATLEEGAVFCKNCGRTIKVNPPPISAPPPQQHTYTNPPPPQPIPNSYAQPNYGAYPPNYSAPVNQPYYQQQDINAPMTVGQYIGTILLTCIPIANIVLLFVWAFSSDTNINKKNYSRATLIISGIGVGIYILFLLIALVSAIII